MDAIYSCALIQLIGKWGARWNENTFKWSCNTILNWKENTIQPQEANKETIWKIILFLSSISQRALCVSVLCGSQFQLCVIAVVGLIGRIQQRAKCSKKKLNELKWTQNLAFYLRSFCASSDRCIWKTIKQSNFERRKKKNMVMKNGACR